MSEELKPCPFCGSTDIKSGGDDKIVGTWCLVCHATGPNEYGNHEWNQRAKPRVKALEWYEADGSFYAKGDDTQVSCNSDGMWAFHLRDWPNLGDWPYNTADEAKAAAQTDFTRRVHACLEGYDD